MYQFNICSLTTYQIHDALQDTQVRPFRKKNAPLFHAFLIGIGGWISSYHPASNTASDAGPFGAARRSVSSLGTHWALAKVSAARDRADRCLWLCLCVHYVP